MRQFIEVEDIEWCSAHCGVIETGRDHCDVYAPGWKLDDDSGPCSGVTVYIKAGGSK